MFRVTHGPLRCIPPWLNRVVSFHAVLIYMYIKVKYQNSFNEEIFSMFYNLDIDNMILKEKHLFRNVPI